MKLLLCSDSKELFDSLHGSGKFEVKMVKHTGQLDESEVLVLDGSLIEISDLKAVKATTETKAFYIMPVHMLRSSLDTLKNEYPDVTFLPPRLTPNQVAEQIILSSFKDACIHERNIHVFYGADSKVGTTMVAQSVAEIIAEHTTVNVGLLYMGSNPVHYFDSQGETGIDTIKIKLFNGILSREDLMKASIKTRLNNLYAITGSNGIQDLRYFHPTHAEDLLNLASECFDIVIVDAGSEIERGLSLGAIRMASSKYLVTTQQQNTKDAFRRVTDEVFHPLQIEKKEFLCVINKYVEGAITEKQLSTVYDVPVIGHLPHLDMKGWQAELDHKSLLHFNHEGYVDGVKQVAEYVCELQKIPFRNEGSKSWFRKWFQ